MLARKVEGDALTIELGRHQPVAAGSLPADPGEPVGAPDWPDATGFVRLFDLPNLGSLAAAVPRLIVAAAGSNDGWRGADSWFVAAPGAAPVAIGAVRPAAALGTLAAPLAAGSGTLFDQVNAVLVTLVNPSMTLESVDDIALLGGANRAMVDGELLQFGDAEPIGVGVWRLSRLLRGRAGTDLDMDHAAGAPFVLLDDAALMALPDELAGWAEGGAAMLQWAPRSGTELTEVAVPGGAAALRPLAPVHGRIAADGAGGVVVNWIRRSRVDTGWRDHVDLPLGESREAWRIQPVPPVAGVGPWDCPAAALHIDAATLAEIPPATAIEIRQIGDFAPSPTLLLPLT